MSAEAAVELRARPDRREDILRVIVREYQDAPRLALTAAQARRLWTLDADTCAQLLSCLVEERILALRPDGRYVRSDSLPRR